MPLSEHENELWKHVTETIDDPVVDFQPIKLPTSAIIETPAELWNLLGSGPVQRKLNETDMMLAVDFFESVLFSGDPRGLISQLPYEQGEDGLELILRFPRHGVDHE